MATLTPSFYNDTGLLETTQIASARRVDFTIDFSKFEYAAEDTINIARLPEGVIVLGATVQQVVPGATGQTGTLVARAGTTAVTAALAGTATAGTVTASVPGAMPHVVPAGGEELNLLANDGTERDTGVVRVVLVLMEGDRPDRQLLAAQRDQIGGGS